MKRYFGGNFNVLVSGTVSIKDISNLGFYFVIPFKGSWIELIPGGTSIKVTDVTASTFTQLVKEKYAELSRNFNSYKSAQEQRINVLKINNEGVYHNMADTASKFSPSHYQHNIFSPYSTENVFHIPMSNSYSMLPPYLSETRQNGFENINAYLKHINGNITGFLSLIEELNTNPMALTKYK